MEQLPECRCEEQGQPKTPLGVMHLYGCEWWHHPKGGNMPLLSDESKQWLAEMDLAQWREEQEDS